MKREKKTFKISAKNKQEKKNSKEPGLAASGLSTMMLLLCFVCSPDWPQTHYMAEAELKFMVLLPPPPFQAQRLQACTTTPDSAVFI